MNEILCERIFSKIKKAPYEAGAYDDLLSLCINEEENTGMAHMLSRDLRKRISKVMKDRVNVAELFQVYRKSLLFDAPYNFDSYMLYLEIDRKPEERFYQPRRRQLKRIVDELQKLADDELDELFINEPPRVGKTSIVMFFMTWVMGRDPERSNLYCAYSDIITKAMYNGVLEILNDPVTYKWHDVFPEAKIVQTNAADETLNINRKKRYPSLTCRSLYGTLNGACDCNGYLISDDLIGGIEEALNKERLISAWTKVDNNLLTRGKENAKLLWVGTRWSVVDPIGIRMELLKTNDKFKNRRFSIINVPALDETGKSNFDFDYGVGFTTEKYEQIRASFEKNDDMASWNAQYMGEPIEREGTLFSPGDLKYYNGVLPEGEPDRIFGPVDPAFGGGDYVAFPIAYQYGMYLYVHDVVYNNGDKKITQPLIAKKIDDNGATWVQVEANKSTLPYKEGIEAELSKRGKKINITSKPASPTKSKQQRIFDKAPDIREYVIFRESGKRSIEYEAFMQNVYSYKLLGTNKHDDAPDSLAMLIEMAFPYSSKVEIFKRFI